MARTMDADQPKNIVLTESSGKGEIVSDRSPVLEHPIFIALRWFNSGISDYANAIRTTMPIVVKSTVTAAERIQKKLDGFVVEDHGKVTLKAHGPHAAKEMIDTIDEGDRLSRSRLPEVVARSFFIGFFTLYDAFIGTLLKAIYSRQPELFKSIKREISLSDLLEFDDIALVKSDMLEKEIDSFRRDSYVEQFLKLESKLEIKTLRDFPEWKQFVEMGQRRNLFTHNDGYVSQQYLASCDKEGVQFAKRPTIGERLSLDPDYLIDSLFIIGKVGFMLGHTLWRKVLPNELAIANDAFNQSLYDLLREQRWKSAAEYGLFGLSTLLRQNLPEVEYKIRLINTAIGLKKSKRMDEAKRLLASADWTACLREFSLAKAVIEDQRNEAANIMLKIGRQGEIIDQLSYHIWPLFDEFRGTQQFLDAYRSVYGIDFIEKASEKVVDRTETMRSEARAKVRTEVTPKQNRARAAAESPTIVPSTRGKAAPKARKASRRTIEEK